MIWVGGNTKSSANASNMLAVDNGFKGAFIFPAKASKA